MMDRNDPLVALLGLDPELVEQVSGTETGEDDARHAALLGNGPIGRAARNRVVAAEAALKDK